MKKVFLFLLMTMATLSLSAQTVHWKNDPEHTRIGFEIGHAGLSIVSGRFTDFDINVAQVGEDLSMTAVDVTVRTNSIKTGVAARDKHLCSADFFNVENYPVMTFKSTKLQVSKGKKGKLYGYLTLLGVSKKVVFDVVLIGRKKSPVSGKDTAGFRLRGQINCSDFNLGPKYIPSMISDKVDIVIDAEFVRD